MSERLPFHLPTDFPIASERIAMGAQRSWSARTAAQARKEMLTKDPRVEELVHHMLIQDAEQTTVKANGILFVWRILNLQSPLLPAVSDKLYDVCSQTDPQEKILENPYLMRLLSDLDNEDKNALKEFKSGAMGIYELKVEAFKQARQFRLH